MAIFIPEWVRAGARDVHLKRVLNALDDDHAVRRPLRREGGAADWFVQHPAKGWLAVGVEDAAFTEVGVPQLFDDERQNRFESRLAELGSGRVPALVVMWNCADEEVRALSKAYLVRFGTRLVSREQFSRLGAKLIGGLLAPLGAAGEQSLMARYFPEAEIPAACTTRRFFHRDNSAGIDRRYFLDPDQEWACKLDLELPEELAGAVRDFSVRLVNGVAGSGKTLIALNRVLLLAERFPAQRLLLLSHNTPIVADLKERLHRTRGGLPANLEISTFFAWAHAQWRAVFRRRPRMPDDPRVVPDLIRRHRPQLAGGLALSDDQLLGELDFINEALIVDEPGYREASRAGRGFALRPKERSQVWALYEAVTDGLARAGLQMWSALPREICLAGDTGETLARHHHIVVDEAQFFAPSWFQLIKRSLQPQGQLFLCADPNQGFMKNRLSWKRVGLDVAGRTKKLRRSYRTTRAILEAASRVLGMLGASDAEDYLQPDFAGMEDGRPPVLLYTHSPQDSTDRLVNELAALLQPGQLPLNAVLVIYGENVSKSGLYGRLGARFGADKVWWFNEKEQKKAPPAGYGRDYLRMAYLDSATGLEAGVVFLIGAEHLLRGERAAGLDPDERAERREENARKLYMAMTRAGQRLVVLSSQRLPQDMERLFLVAGRS
ncbi:MAG: AAA family ATPase [Rubrivivax sp.]